GAILVLEDVGEAPYRIDRMLTHWRLSGALGQLAGIAFGAFSDCDSDSDVDENEAAAVIEADPDAPGTGPGAGHRRLEQVLRERSLDLGIPVLAGLPLGHRCGNATLPLGARARLDADAGRLDLVAWPPSPH
ncbi:MAG: hypothetical protein ACK516_02805, partial [Cyanobium sp.]